MLPSIRACAVGLTALYLKGGPNDERVERRKWPAVQSLFLRHEASIETLSDCARREGFAQEALILETPGVLSQAETLYDSRQVVTSVDGGYPARWAQTLGAGAPPALWRTGQTLTSAGPAIAVVGMREISATTRRAATTMGKTAAENGFSLFSGNAIGCDSAAMKGAVSEGGRVVGLLPHGLNRLKRRLPGVEYWSVCRPDEEFSRALAMERNALIYAAAEYAVVVEARLREGGTWHGAVDAHRRKLTKLIVLKNERSAGNRALIALGAVPLQSPQDLLHALSESGHQPDLFE